MMYYQNKNINTFNPKIIALFAVLILFAAVPVTVLFSRNQVQYQQLAWATAQSAKSVCISGTARIEVSFTNQESSRSIDVLKVKDVQTDKTIDLGTIKPLETKTGTIDTGLSKINNGSVIFYLTWTNPPPGSDTRSANYSAISCSVPTPTPSPTPVPQPSCRPIPIPSCIPGRGILCILPCSQVTPSVSPSPTTTPICQAPKPVTNVLITCPNCSNQPTIQPTQY